MPSYRICACCKGPHSCFVPPYIQYIVCSSSIAWHPGQLGLPTPRLRKLASAYVYSPSDHQPRQTLSELFSHIVLKPYRASHVPS